MKFIISSLFCCLFLLIACNAQRRSLKLNLNKRIQSQLNVKPYASFSSRNGGHNSHVQTIAVLTNGLVASGSLDNSIKIWDLEKKKLSFTFNSSRGGHSDWVF
jgi:WD40 repeat protein